MKRTITLLLLGFAPLSFAQVHWDTLSILPVGPGCLHMRLVAPTVPWTMNVLAIDLRIASISLETVKANDRLVRLERTSSMASRRDSNGHHVVGAVNGDFYSGGAIPSNIQVAGGQVVVGPSERSSIGFG